MQLIVRALAVAARRYPIVIIAVSLLSAALLGYFAGQVEIAQGNEAFSPDNAEIAAAERIAELFGADQGSVLQVMIRQPEGDVISAEGLETVRAVEETIRTAAGDRLAGAPGMPPVVSYLTPVIQAGAAQGLPLDDLGDDEVKALYSAALSQAPPDQAGLVTGLLSQDGDVTAASAPAGLVLAFFAGEEGDVTAALDRQIALEEEVAVALEALDSSLEVRPFSFNLLFGAVDDFTGEVGRLFALAGAIIVAILVFVYWLRPREGTSAIRAGRRSLADMALTMLTILMAIAMMQGGGVLLERAGIISSFSPPTQIVPILLIGLGVDYGIHLISRYREELGQGASVDESMSRSIGTSGVALVLATLTTVIGFLTNVTNPVPALADFGILSALGILVSFLLMLTFVPAVRLLLDRLAERSGRLPVASMGAQSERFLPRIMGRTAVIAERAPAAAIAVAVVLAGLGLWGFTRLETRFSFTDFLPEDAPAIETLELLETEFGGGFGEQTQVLIEGPDLGTATVHNALVEASASLATAEGVATFETPTGPVASAASPISVLAQALAPGPEAAPPALQEAAEQVGLGPDLMVPAGADVTALYAAAAGAVPEELAAVTSFDGGRLIAVLFDVRTTAGEARVGELRQDMEAAFAPAVEAGAGAIVTSQNVIGDVVVNALTASQSSSLVWTLVAAAAVLVAYFGLANRRPFLGIITMAPVAMVVLWTYGLMYLAGIPFGPVTATLAALAIGIGVPFTIHITRRFEEDRLAHPDLDDAIRSTATHTGGALAGSAFTTMAGFGILVTSSLVPFKQMGQVTAFAIGLSLVASILVLPSMLALSERGHRRRAGRRPPRRAVRGSHRRTRARV